MRAVITFHSIDDFPGPLSYPPKGLKAMIEALTEADIPILPLHALLADVHANGVALTFDDGLWTVFSKALPILREHEVPAHVFVIANWVGGENRWPGQPASAGPYRLMGWDQLAAIQSAGFRIEAHTANHPDLRLLSDDRIVAEMEEGDSLIERRLGHRPCYFAYPYGYNDTRVRLLAARRYRGCFTTRLDYLSPGDELAALPRLDSHYLRSPRLVRVLPGKSAHAYISVRRILRRFRRH